LSRTLMRRRSRPAGRDADLERRRIALAHGQHGIAQQIDQHAHDGRLVAAHQGVDRQIVADADIFRFMPDQADGRVERAAELEMARFQLVAALAVGKGF